MRYCPTCDSEYRDGVTTCVDDGSTLLTRAEWEAALKEQGRSPDPRLLRNIVVVDSRFEAEALADALADEGFRPNLVETKGSIVGPLTVPARGQYAIAVPPDEIERASALAAELRAALSSSTSEAEAAAEREERESEAAPAAP